MSERDRSGGYVDDARRGDVERLGELARTDVLSAFKWLLVAQDFGHAAAEELLADLVEHHDELRYDDDGYAQMQVHFELAEGYLRGLEGLPRDAGLATKHLHEFFDGPHESLQSARAEYVDGLLAKLDTDATQVVMQCVANQPFRAARRRLDRVQRLWELQRDGAQVPRVIVEAELERLQAEVQVAVHAALAAWR